MAERVRLWKIGGNDQLQEIQAAKLSLERRIENWIADEIEILDPNLLLIGRQVHTSSNKIIDLLCIDGEGRLSIVELKRGLASRQVTGQALDYASWIRARTASEINQIAARHFGSEQAFKNAFREKFFKLPELNTEDHSILLVVTDIDESTHRIIRYLSEKHIDIRAVQFHIFRSDDGIEQLVRTYVVDFPMINKPPNRTSITERLPTISNEEAKRFFVTKSEHETNQNHTALAYRVADTIRWYVEPRTAFALVTQIGRFSEDEQMWSGNLSRADVKPVRRNNNLKFLLWSNSDFQFFEGFVNRLPMPITWSGGASEE